ncbi:hypothetical protein [Paenibacillus sp. PL2-23]|uniref:hypothetical protein n=1 Tax=Paenibacillus sp. PL2-23 TaxID=2100729 RepID=UPI0030FB7F46
MKSCLIAMLTLLLLTACSEVITTRSYSPAAASPTAVIEYSNSISAPDSNISNNVEDWTVSPLFESGSYTMIGEEGKLGFIYDDGAANRFYANQTQKYMWHFWGTSESLSGSLTVEGTHKETGETITVLYSNAIGGAHNGADAHLPSLMSLPSPGLWRLDAYIGDNFFGRIVVEVVNMEAAS